jgi:hypothetical protein
MDKLDMISRTLKACSELSLGVKAALERNYTENQIKVDIQIEVHKLLTAMGVSIEACNKIQQIIDEDLKGKY